MATASPVVENNIQQVKEFIKSHHFTRALKIINTLQSEYPSSALVLALKALLYERTGRTETLDICSDAKKNFTNDISVLPDVLDILQTVFQRLREYDLATSYYEYACEKVPNSLALMTGHFYCYVRGLSFNDQLKISLKMYMFDRERGRRFLFWSVLSIQSQVFYQLLSKHLNLVKLVKPETLLVCISVTEQQAENSFVHEILSKLGLTLLVAEVGGQCIKVARLLARVCDYTAAAECLSQKLESCLDDWDGIFNNLCQLLGNVLAAENQITLPIFLVRKLSQLSGYDAHSLIPVADLRMGRKRCVDGSNSELEKAVHEYFGRLGSNMGMSFQVLPKVDELQLIKNLLKQYPSTIALQEKFNGLLTINRKTSHGKIDPGLKSGYHGTSIALKTNKFVILAADGKFTSRTSYNALKLKADKVRDFGNMCVAVTGDWANSAKMISTLSTCMRVLKEENKSRPTISKFADFTMRKLSYRIRDTEIIFGAFDPLKDGKTDVPCISYANGLRSVDIEDFFFSAGTGSSYAEMILSEGNVDMKLGEAITLVERALVYASMHDDCTGGWASIHVIKDGGKVIEIMPREDICSTLWNRHHASLSLDV